MDKKKRDKIIVIIIALLIIIGIYFWFVYQYPCPNITCFNSHLKSCSKSTYLNNAPDALWKYEIKGLKNINGEKNCEVKVTLSQLKAGYYGAEKLEGLDMTCYIKKGVVALPNSDIENCRGELKEKMQTLIIEKLHQYVINNIGEIDEEAIQIL